MKQDDAEALKWLQLAAEQDEKSAHKGLDLLQQNNLIPTPPPGTAVTTVLLASANASRHNNKTGRVVEPPSPAMARPGIAFVLLDGEAKPRMFKVTNLRV